MSEWLETNWKHTIGLNTDTLVLELESTGTLDHSVSYLQGSKGRHWEASTDTFRCYFSILNVNGILKQILLCETYYSKKWTSHLTLLWHYNGKPLCLQNVVNCAAMTTFLESRAPRSTWFFHWSFTSVHKLRCLLGVLEALHASTDWQVQRSTIQFSMPLLFIMVRLSLTPWAKQGSFFTIIPH